jgi:hypothetical protein
MDYFRTALVIAPQIFAGCLIYLLLLKRTEVAAIELLSIGFAIGITASTICDQIFVNLNWPKIGWLLPLALSLVTGSYVLWAKKIDFARIIWRREFKETFFPVIAIAATALGTEWFWLFPSGVFLVIAATLMYFPEFRFQKILTRLSLLISVVAMYVMVSTRPKIWWMLEEVEYPFFEALSSSLASWGIQDYILASGTELKYHWFTYAWIGIIDRSSNIEIFRSSTLIAPVVFTVAITSLIWSLINRFSLSVRKTYLFTLVSMTASSYPIWGGGIKITMLSSPSQFFAFAFSITTLFLLLESSEDKIRFSPILIGVMAGATVLAKVFHGVAIFSVAAFTIFLFGVYSRNISRLLLTNCLVAITSTILVFLSFIFVKDGQSNVRLRFSDFLWQIHGDLRSFPDIYVKFFGLLTIVSLAILPLTLLILLKTHEKKSFDSAHFVMSVGVLIGGISGAGLTVFGNGENLYFLHAAVSLSSILSFTHLAKQRNLQLLKPKNLLLAVLGGACLTTISYAIPNFDSGSNLAIILRTLKSIAPAWLLIICLALVWLSNLISKQQKSKSFCNIAVAAATMSIAFALFNWIDIAPEKTDEFRRNGTSYLATSELLKVSSWVIANTSEDDIIASNFGWPDIEDAELESYSLSCIAYQNKTVLEETCNRTKNPLLAAYLDRRLWLQATVLQYSAFNENIKQRQLVSIQFASKPSSLNLQIMNSDGVDWFVVDRSTTSLESWLPFAEIRYASDSFFVLKI